MNVLLKGSGSNSNKCDLFLDFGLSYLWWVWKCSYLKGAMTVSGISLVKLPCTLRGGGLKLQFYAWVKFVYRKWDMSKERQPHILHTCKSMFCPQFLQLLLLHASWLVNACWACYKCMSGISEYDLYCVNHKYFIQYFHCSLPRIV